MIGNLKPFSDFSFNENLVIHFVSEPISAFSKIYSQTTYIPFIPH